MSLYSASWIAWVMFALLVVALLSPLIEVTSTTIQRIFSHSERTYAMHVRSWMSELSIRVFRFGVVAMATLLCVASTNEFLLVNYAKVLCVFAVLYSLQALLIRGVGYVFVPAKRMDVAMEQYDNVRTSMCVCAYPILLLLINISFVSALPQVLCGIVFVVYVIVLLGKSIQLLYTHPLSILYILLYIICLEIFPLMASIFVVQHIL